LYKAVYSEEAVRQIVDLRPAGKRRHVLDQIERLAENPSTQGDFEVIDSQRRTNQIVVFSGIAITFWSDHAVKELRVVAVTSFGR